MKTISEADARFRFKAWVTRQGGQTAAAAKLGLTVSYINDVWHERRGLSRKVQEAIGVRKVAEIRFEVLE